MLKYGRNKVIAFDFDEALTFEGDSGPYLQYSTVRVQNIFRKMKERGVDPLIDDRSLDNLTLNEGLTDEMWELVRLSAEMPAAIRRAVDSLELSVVTHQLLELAQKFNSFYHKYPILNEKDDAERQQQTDEDQEGGLCRAGSSGPAHRFRLAERKARSRAGDAVTSPHPPPPSLSC